MGTGERRPRLRRARADLPRPATRTARVALEQHEPLLSASERIEAHFALWEADGETVSLEAAWRELRRLQGGAPAEDRERMLTHVDLHRRVATAWKEHGG